jgi:hypothetical protein
VSLLKSIHDSVTFVSNIYQVRSNKENICMFSNVLECTVIFISQLSTYLDCIKFCNEKVFLNTVFTNQFQNIQVPYFK